MKYLAIVTVLLSLNATADSTIDTSILFKIDQTLESQIAGAKAQSVQMMEQMRHKIFEEMPNLSEKQKQEVAQVLEIYRNKLF